MIDLFNQSDGPQPPPHGGPRFPFQQKLPVRLPAFGCFAFAAAALTFCVLPYFIAGLMQTALEKLHIAPSVAILVVLSIFIGSMINWPIYKREQDELEVDPKRDLEHLGGGPHFRRVQSKTVIAVNVGGCVVPVLLALWQIIVMVTTDPRTFYIALFMAGLNALVCYRIARPVANVGIVIPGFVSPLLAVGLSWLLIRHTDLRASAAFVAGVTGPLIGADLLHLRKLLKTQTGILSIGGAGTFDGIVLSGLMAALLA